ncbi:MAG: dienelactone hydrolase family protein [Candidatus Dormibacteria bacterium]
MADVILFHHALGQTPGFLALADELRARGHQVHAPDLYDGHTFNTIEAGVNHARSVGFEQILERGVRAAESLPEGLVYAGISLGVMPAQKLAQTRAGARGAVLLEACLPYSEFGTAWPGTVPVQIHGMDADPSFAVEGDLDAARELVEATPGAELFLYPGDRHLFTDSSFEAYDSGATALVLDRVGEFLRRCQ